MFVSIDVSKDWLDVHVRPSKESFAVPCDGAGSPNSRNSRGRPVRRWSSSRPEMTEAARLAACGAVAGAARPFACSDVAAFAKVAIATFDATVQTPSAALFHQTNGFSVFSSEITIADELYAFSLVKATEHPTDAANAIDDTSNVFAKKIQSHTALAKSDRQLKAFEVCSGQPRRAATFWNIAQLHLQRKPVITDAVPCIVEAYPIFEQLGRDEGITASGLRYGHSVVPVGRPDAGRAVLRRLADTARHSIHSTLLKQIKPITRRAVLSP